MQKNENEGTMKKRRILALLCCFCMLVGSLVHTAMQTKKVMYPIEQKVMILDAGHGGWDPGKTGTNGKDEKELNLSVVEKLQCFLEQGGATVLLTRATDEALGTGKREDLAERKKIANEMDGDILVSIHQNAFPSAAAKGAQVFYHASSESAKMLAECIQESLRERVDGNNNRQAKENKEYYILRTTTIPAVIVECGFLSNREEEALLNDTAYQEKLAWAIYCGILDYFEKTAMI